MRKVNISVCMFVCSECMWLLSKYLSISIYMSDHRAKPRHVPYIPNFREHLIFAQIREGVGQWGSGGT